MNYKIRLLIHNLVKLFNSMIGYKIWNKGEEPEVK